MISRQLLLNQSIPTLNLEATHLHTTLASDDMIFLILNLSWFFSTSMDNRQWSNLSLLTESYYILCYLIPFRTINFTTIPLQTLLMRRSDDQRATLHIAHWLLTNDYSIIVAWRKQNLLAKCIIQIHLAKLYVIVCFTNIWSVCCILCNFCMLARGWHHHHK